MALNKIRLKLEESPKTRRFKAINLKQYFLPTGVKISPIDGIYETDDPWEISTLEYFESQKRDLVEELHELQ